MEIITYQDKFKIQIIDMILNIQNNEAKINLPLEEQPDLQDIPNYYEKNDGVFLVAIENDEVIGTIALMNYNNGNGVLKKFFVKKEYRNKGIGRVLFSTLHTFAKDHGFHTVLLDTPSVAKDSHRFYEKSGFRKISENELPFKYEYPDRNSIVFRIDL